MQTSLDGKILQRLEEQGVARIPAVDPVDLLSIASQLGSPTADFNSEELIRVISPAHAGRSSESLSSRYGLGEFPFHTECAYWREPPKYILLHCLTPGAGDRPTGYCDVASVSNLDMSPLHDSLYRIRRSSGSFLARCFERVNHDWRVRADRDCMLPVDESRDPLRIVLFPAIRDKVIWHHWEQNELLILDNWRVVHGRGSASTIDHDRQIARLLVKKHAN